MNNLFKNNAYHVLGLSVTASNQEIVKRYKKVKAQLKINQVPGYPSDIPLFDPEEFRTLNSTEEAHSALVNPEEKIKEVFFWFYIKDDLDQVAWELIHKRNFQEGFLKWKGGMNDEQDESLHYARNLAILGNLILLRKENKKVLKATLSCWKKVLNSDSFWNRFRKWYQTHDDLNTEKNIFNQFREQADDKLNDFYTELSEHYNNKIYLTSFAKNISTDGEAVRERVLEPIYVEIQEKMERVKSIDLQNAGAELDGMIRSVYQSLNSISKKFQKLRNIGYRDEMRAYRLGKQVVDTFSQFAGSLLNELDRPIPAIKILDKLTPIAEESGKDKQIQNYLENARKRQGVKEELEQIEVLVDEERYEEALELLDKKKDKLPPSKSYIQEAISEYRKVCILDIAVNAQMKGKRKLTDENYAEADKWSRKAYHMARDNVELFNLLESDVEKVLEDLEEEIRKLKNSTTRFAVARVLENISEIQDIYSTKIQEGYGETPSGTLFLIILNSYVQLNIAETVHSSTSSKGGIIKGSDQEKVKENSTDKNKFFGQKKNKEKEDELDLKIKFTVGCLIYVFVCILSALILSVFSAG